MSSIAIITARGGSKRIPRKNIKEFCGRPMLGYAVGAALASGLFDEVMVSTDDDEIAGIARAEGAAVPFMRSASAADDHATTADVLREVLAVYAESGRRFDTACCIYPTAPFLTPERLREAAGLLESTGARCVMPVTAFSFPPQRGLFIRGGRIVQAQPECASMRSQDLERMYHDAGQFYFFRAAPFMGDGILVGRDTVPVVLSDAEVQDIDNPEDWEIAEFKYRWLHREEA